MESFTDELMRNSNTVRKKNNAAHLTTASTHGDFDSARSIDKEEAQLAPESLEGNMFIRLSRAHFP